MALFSDDPGRRGFLYLLWLRYRDWYQTQQDEDDFEDFGSAMAVEVYAGLVALAPFLVAFAVWSPVFTVIVSVAVAAGGPLTILNTIFRARYEERALCGGELREALQQMIVFLVFGQAFFVMVMMFRS